jgi:hypothetical protein
MIESMLVGAAVFETYCYTVGSFAPPAKKNDSSASTMIPNGNNNNDDNHNDDVDASTTSSNAFSCASPSLHTMSGALGGAGNGIVGTMLESSTAAAACDDMRMTRQQ